MINRILYWFITLPLLGKTGCLTTIIVMSTCMLLFIVSIPATQARRVAQATQVAINSTATQVAQVTATIVAEEQAEATRVARAAGATQTSVAQEERANATKAALAESATQEAIVGSTATAQAHVNATSTVVALAATSQANADATATALAAPTPVPLEVAQIAYEELRRDRIADRTWVSILIPPDMERATIIQLAQQLREQDVSSSFHIFDDASKVNEFIDSSINYGKVRDRDGKIKDMEDCIDMQYCADLIKQGKSAYPYPEAWANQHYIAMINEMFISRGKTQWQLIFQDDWTTVDINVGATVWGGQRQNGSVTEQEIAGWTQQYMMVAKDFACCITGVNVDAQNLAVTITLTDELAARPEQARQAIASGVFTNFASHLGECLTIVRFVDTQGNSFSDSYRNTGCR